MYSPHSLSLLHCYIVTLLHCYVLDVVGVLNDQDDYTKNRNYWKYLKTKLKKEGNELVSVTNQLKILAPDGKRRLTDIPWRCIGRFRGHGPDFLAEMTSYCPDF